ncbi:AbrB family transcriptional regulator [Pseudomonas sp. F1_0610]|uniref:AbrB family transcriptional regulator n=1 Tax=Pseudomonas sp. F1_0610 TaxID=3114284 RepID=UPI0039C179BB
MNRMAVAGVLVGVLGGYIASLIHLPLPWMIGSLLSVIAVRCSGIYLEELPHMRTVGQWLVACGIGLHFTPEVWAQVVSHSWVILLGALATVSLTTLGLALLHKARFNPVTSFFASLPGGASEMVNLAIKHKAEIDRVTAAHSMRMMLIVVSVPLAFTWGMKVEPQILIAAIDWKWLSIALPSSALVALLWRKLGLPSPWMLGPILTCAVLSISFDLHVALPSTLSHLGQLCLGAAFGCHFDRPFFRKAPKFLAIVVLYTVLAIAITTAIAFALSAISGISPYVLILGMMPGGISEMSITAEALQLEVALVTALQVLRLFLVMFMAEPLFRLWMSYLTKEKQ